MHVKQSALELINIFLLLLELTNIVVFPPKGDAITSLFSLSSANWLFSLGIAGHLTRSFGCGFFLPRVLARKNPTLMFLIVQASSSSVE